jgi:Tfp pilus assembly protein PilO
VNNRRAPIIAGAAAVIVAILAIVLLVLPKMGEVTEVEADLEAAQDQEVQLEAQLRALQQAQEDAPETEAEILEIEAQIPPTADLPSLFRLLDGAANQAAVDFFAFTPGTPVANATGQYSTIASTVTVSGGYFSIDEFLFLLETLPRAAKVTTIAVAPEATETASNNLQLQLTVEFFTTDTNAGPGSVPGPTEGVTTPPSEPSAPTTEPGAS